MVVIVERINNQNLRKLLDLLFLISSLPLIYPLPFPGPSDGPPLFPEPLISSVQLLRFLKKVFYSLTMFPKGDRRPLSPVAMETFYLAIEEGSDLPEAL